MSKPRRELQNNIHKLSVHSAGQVLLQNKSTGKMMSLVFKDKTSLENFIDVIFNRE